MKHIELYYNEIPYGKENALTYDDLCALWNCTPRKARAILHEISLHDAGDDYIVIRSAKSKGFYKTDNKDEIEAYRKECLSKGRSIFAPVKKCNRILKAESKQFEFFNNLRNVRISKGMSQPEVCKQMREIDIHFDVPLLSKMENGVCLPTTAQTAKLAEIYGVEPAELVRVEILDFDIFEAI